MNELQASRSLQSRGIGLSQGVDTEIQFNMNACGLDSSYFTIVNSGLIDLFVAFGGYDNNGDVDTQTVPSYPDDYFVISPRGHIEFPPAAFNKRIKIWMRGEKATVIY